MPSLSVRGLGLILSLFGALTIYAQSSQSTTQSPTQPPTQISGRAIEPGKTLSDRFSEAEIAAHSSHYYDFTGKAGQYIEIHGQQEGYDVRLHIIGPDGAEIANSDSYNGAYGPEYWRGLLSRAGSFRIGVECLSARGNNPHYQISIIVKSSASANDIKRAQAQQLYNQGWQRKQSNVARNVEEAFYYFDQAATLYGEAGDLLGQAQSLHSAASLDSPVVTNRLRFELYKEALDLYRRSHEAGGEAVTVHCLGMIYAAHNHTSEAIALYQQALAAHRQVGDRRGEAIALNDLGLAYCDMNLPQEALRYFKLALSTCHETGDKIDEAKLLKYIGDLYGEMGEAKEQARCYKESESLGGEKDDIKNDGRH